MATDLEGKAAFIADAAHGQPRVHAQRLAALGVNIIGVDICDDSPGVDYPESVEILTPDDIADAVEWLVSDRARDATGIQLPVDAGFTVRQQANRENSDPFP
jgi:(+)-trans-carveol dehydrogenase/(-)-trans-carveol dehydrogenase